MFRKIFILISVISAAVWGIEISGRIEAKSRNRNEFANHTQEKAKPDLLVEKIEVSSEPLQSGKTVLNIAYTIYNDSPAPSRCCPTDQGKRAWKDNSIMTNMFQSVIEAREYPKGQFFVIDIGTSSIELEAHERQTFYATEIFSPEMQWEFRVRLDPENWIDEEKEDNNEMLLLWPQEGEKN